MFRTIWSISKIKKTFRKPIIQIPPKHSKRSKIHCDSTHLPLLWQPPWPVQPFARPFGADVVAPPPASPHPGRAQPRRCRSPRRPRHRAVTEGHGLRTPRPRRCRRDGQERTPWKQQLQPRFFRKIVENCIILVVEGYNLKFHLLQLRGWEVEKGEVLPGRIAVFFRCSTRVAVRTLRGSVNLRLHFNHLPHIALSGPQSTLEAWNITWPITASNPCN